MTIDDIHKLLEQRQAAIRGLETRLDFIYEHLLLMSVVTAFHVTDPDGLEEECSPDELLKVMQDTQKTTHQKIELLAALRQRIQQRRHPPSSQN